MRPLPNKACIHAAILLVAVICLSPVGTVLGKTLSIDNRDSVIDIEAYEMPLAAILKALSEKTGLSLNLDQPLTDAFSCDLKAVTLEEAIKRLLANQNHALTYRKTYDGRFLVDQLFVMGANASRQSFSQISVDKARMPAKDNPSYPIRYLKRVWFRQQFKEVDKLSGQLTATFIYDGSGVGGILINGISEESPLKVIGLRVGDVIQKVNGKAIHSARELLQQLCFLTDNANSVGFESIKENKAYFLLFLELQ